MRHTIPRIRHLRYSILSRLRRSKHLPDFLAAQATDLTASPTAVTVTPTAHADAVAAARVLTLSGNAVAAETVTIGSTVYTWRAAPTTVAGEVKVGADAQASIDNLVAAITLAAGAGSLYGSLTAVHPTVTAVKSSASTMTATAKTAGVAGNAIASTETMTAGAWAGVTLAGGADEVHASFAATAHGFAAGEGPVQIAATTTIPAGLVAGALYYVNRISADAFALAHTQVEAVRGARIEFTSVGAGTRTVARAVTATALYDKLRQGVDPRRLAAATDIDTL